MLGKREAEALSCRSSSVVLHWCCSFLIVFSITFQHQSNTYIFRQHVKKISLWVWHQNPIGIWDALLDYLAKLVSRTGWRVTSASYISASRYLSRYRQLKIDSSVLKFVPWRVCLCCCRCPSGSVVKTHVIRTSWTPPVRRDECRAERERTGEQKSKLLRLSSGVTLLSYSSAKRCLQYSRLSSCKRSARAAYLKYRLVLSLYLVHLLSKLCKCLF